MKSKSTNSKKKPNVKVIAGVVGAVCVLGVIGGGKGGSDQPQTTSTAYETTVGSIEYSEETTSIKVVENKSTEENTAAPTVETTTVEATTIETTTVETTTAEPTTTETAAPEITEGEVPTVESTTPEETTTQTVPETTTEIATTTEAVTESLVAEQPTTINAGDELVWVSETGKKYHSKNTCYPINPDNARQVTKEEAVNVLGLEPCGKCYK